MNQSAEEKIKQAALNVFIQKGSANCTSREIAREAGMNVALVNYYFRSKSKLFAIIFESVMQEFLKSMIQVFSSDLPIRDKIKILIEREFEFLSQHPDIPNFVLNELARNPEAIDGFRPVLNMVSESGVFQEAINLQKKRRNAPNGPRSNHHTYHVKLPIPVHGKTTHESNPWG